MPDVSELSGMAVPGPANESEDVFVFPASFAQQRLWFLDKLEPGQNTYNVPFAIRLKGALKVPALEQALRELINRHEVLRTTFAEDEAGKPIQLVASEQQFTLPVSDLSSFPAESRAAEVRRLVIQHARLPFDLKHGPLFRANLFRVANDEYILCLAFHHIIVDGWSWGVVARELSALYEAFDQKKESPLAPLPIQYGDYATWQQDWLSGERLEKLLGYWKKQLDNAPSALELPTDRPRPELQTFRGAGYRIVLPKATADALKELSRGEGTTLFMMVLAAFYMLLARYSGQDDIVVGTPIAGRNRAELENLIGFFVNMLPLRIRLTGNPTFKQLLAQVKEVSLGAYAHLELPFEKLVEELKLSRDLSRNPVFQVMFAFQNISRQRLEFAGLSAEPFRASERTTAKFDLSLSASDSAEGLALAFEYNTDLFEAATIERVARSFNALLAAIAENADRTLAEFPLLREPLQVIPRTERLRPSLAQERLWFMDQLEPQLSVHNLPLALRLTGPLDIPALRNSLNRIVARHESLRTWFESDDNGSPMQMITPALEVDLRVESVMSVPERVRETEVRRLVSAEVNAPFDLTTGPLIRVLLVKVADGNHILVINTHRIISDRASLDILHDELVCLYKQEVEREVIELAPLPVQYADFAGWQRQSLSGELLQEQLRYWKQQLRGAPTSLDLPTDRPRPPEQSYSGANSVLAIPKDLTEELLAIGRGEGTTLFVVLLGAFNVLLSRYTGQDDILVGSPVAGRSQAELENLVGLFANPLVLRTRLSGKESFRELLQNLRETVAQAYAHQDLPFERLVEAFKPERDLSRNPLFQVMFSLENATPGKQTIGDFEICGMRMASSTSRFDLTVTATEQESGLRLLFEYATALFNESTIQQLQRHWLRLLQAIVANPDSPVFELALMDAGEWQQVLVDWNATTSLIPSTLLHQFVEQQTARTPDAVALIDDTAQISYRELNSRANQLARKLQKLGAGPEVLVAVCTERCADMVVGLLAVLKSGGAYVPLDPLYPKDRVAKILEDSHARIMITQESLSAILPPHSAELIFLDRDWPVIALESDTNLDVGVAAENLAYVLFTSGSTGRPKGVALEHRSASIFVQWAQTVYSPEELSGTLFGTSICFDLSIFEMFVPLSVGGTVIIAQNALALRDLPAANKVRLINTVPSAIAELLRMDAVPESVLTVNLAGEALPETLAREIYQQTSIRKLYNLYGPTEDTTYSTYTLVPRTGEVTIGRPIANTQAYILDARRQPVPIGVPGELYLAGDGLARGYYGRDDLTAERFVANPFSQQPNARMYRTGDSCRYRTDGTIEYLGRIDNQVKLRGFRIELGEIESLLAQHPSIRQGVVVVREDRPGDKRLVGYVVANAGQQMNVSEVRDSLRQGLPDYMVPSTLVELSALPLTPNGKVDRKALPAPDLINAATGAAVVPRNQLEERLLAIWQNVLQNPAMGVTDNFFELGGHSLMAAQLVSQMEKTFGRKIPLAALFRGPTVEGMARVLREGTESAADPLVMRIQAGRTAPFFAVVAPGMDSIGYAALAQAMGPQQTFYKLQSYRAVKPDAPITLEEMRSVAREYVQAMRTVQPKGPYYLGGMCAGTHIGEQMILQLEAQGEKVALFAIFDTWVRQNSHVRWRWYLSYYRQRLHGMLRMSPRGQLKTIGQALSKKVHRAIRLQRPAETSFTKLYWPGKDFKTPHFQAPVALFKRPKQPFYYIKNESMGWAERSQGGVHICCIDFPHRMLREPYVRELAKRLLECLSRVTPTPVERLQVWPKVSETTPSMIDVEA